MSRIGVLGGTDGNNRTLSVYADALAYAQPDGDFVLRWVKNEEFRQARGSTIDWTANFYQLALREVQFLADECHCSYITATDPEVDIAITRRGQSSLESLNYVGIIESAADQYEIDCADHSRVLLLGKKATATTFANEFTKCGCFVVEYLDDDELNWIDQLINTRLRNGKEYLSSEDISGFIKILAHINKAEYEYACRECFSVPDIEIILCDPALCGLADLRGRLSSAWRLFKAGEYTSRGKGFSWSELTDLHAKALARVV